MKQKVLLVVNILLVILGLLAVMSGIIGNLIPLMRLPVAVLANIRNSLPILVGLTLCLLVVAFILHKQELTNGLLDRRYRLELLEKIHTFWIMNVLEQSLHNAPLITLELHELQIPFVNGNFQQPRVSSPLPSGTRIIKVYDNAQGELIILGGEGYGKTTLLLELARDLLTRAIHDTAYPIPVILNLSSWAGKQVPLVDWVIEELHRTYQIPQAISKMWIKNNTIQLLLDGLSEVPEASIAQCIDAINLYRSMHNPPHLVICSDSNEYRKYVIQGKHVPLREIIELHPLTMIQIDGYLHAIGETVSPLRKKIYDNPVLREISKTPFMLNMLCLVYTHIDEISQASNASDARLCVLSAYLQEVQKHQKTIDMQHMQRLSWLAQCLRTFHQNEFSLEDIRVNWIPQKWLRRLYYSIAIGLLVLLFSLLAIWQFGDIFAGLLIGSFLGLIFGLYTPQLEKAKAKSLAWDEVQQLFLNGVSGAWYGILGGGISAILLCLLAWLLFVKTVGAIDEIRIGVLLVGVSSIVGGIISGTIVGLSFGAVGHPIYKRKSSHQNIFLLAIASRSILIGIFVGSAIGRLSNNLGDPHAGLFFGLFFGVVSSLFFGGNAYYHHVILRLLLWLTGYMPWHYDVFLKNATESAFLYKLGSSYIFIHQALRDYLATVNISKKVHT